MSHAQAPRLFFVLPCGAPWPDDADGPLFLRSFRVPRWALARIFGRAPMFWYRLEVGLGRHSIVGTTVRHATLPEHLVADEHHQQVRKLCGRKLCGRARAYGHAYRYPEGHRMSNLLDRVMRAMNRYNEEDQHLPGSEAACQRHVRAGALLYNFRPGHPPTARASGGAQSPVERLNKHCYQDNGLQNLRGSGSLAGYRR
jgi:hypothetical protein